MDLIQILTQVPETCQKIPDRVFDLTSLIITIIKFGIPVLLIIFGMLDLGKAVVASKEDEIKKGQQMFIKRTVTAVIVFFVVVVVELVVNFATKDTEDEGTVWNCVEGFIYGVDKNYNIKK